MADIIAIENSEKPNEEKKVVITETVTETRTKYEGTVNDLVSEIASLTSQIAELLTMKDAKETLKATIEAELAKN